MRGDGTAMSRNQRTQDQDQSAAAGPIRFALLVWILAMLFLVMSLSIFLRYAAYHVPFFSFLLPLREAVLHFFTARYVF
jgi:hypothetical protein